MIIILNYSLKSEQTINKSIIFALHIKKYSYDTSNIKDNRAE